MAFSAASVFQNDKEGGMLVDANTQFAFNLYMQQSAQSDGNIFMSPLSISVALAMTYLGAKGNTLTQMKSALCFNDINQLQLHPSFSDIMNALKCSDGSYTLHMANRLFGEKTYKFLDEYLNESKKYYNTELAAISFIGNWAGAASEINSWVAENTNQKIKDIIPAGVINDLTRLILVNAIYFKGDWNKKFEKAKAKEADFSISINNKVKVQMMYMTKAKVQYGANPDLNCQVIELPYVKNALSMFILLPDNTVTNLKDLEAKLTSDHLMNIEKKFGMREREVNIWLPRFKLDENLDLGKMLSSMGMQDLFTEGVADLSGFDGTLNLFVFKVLHRAYIEVNEEGSEAAGATAVVMQMRCAAIPMVKESFNFKADHPFIFFIRDNSTKSVLFLGRLIKP